MITALTLKFGANPDAEPLRLAPATVTVFVGPNNSGKSRILQELDRFCQDAQPTAGNVIFESLEFAALDDAQVEDWIGRALIDREFGEVIYEGQIKIGAKSDSVGVRKQDLIDALKNPQTNQHIYCAGFLRFRLLKLDGKNRIDLVSRKPAGDLQERPQNSFQTIFADDDKRRSLRDITFDAIGGYLAVDPTELGQLRLRYSNREPASVREERGVDAEAVAFHSQAQMIDEMSDGVKAFTGIMLEVIAGEPSVLLIDEPEAFLHPILSFKLGREITKAATRPGQRIFASTHSSSFLMGCTQAGPAVSIVRLTYRGNRATARILPHDELVPLMRNPLLRSAQALNALFHESVVVTEADSDRAFYQEINERLARFAPDREIPNCLFLNAQNRQTVHTLMRPLRKLGIPAAVVVDIDVLKEGGTNFQNLLQGANIPEVEGNALSAQRGDLNRQFERRDGNMKRDGGIELLEAGDRESANNFFDRLAEYGIFVVRRGELEVWLRDLGAAGHGTGWLIDIFERMGEDPEARNYVRPEAGDVWEFVSSMRRWLVDPDRKGVT